MDEAAAVIAEHFARWEPLPPIVRVVFDEPQPAAMTVAVDAFCRRALGSGVERIEFFEASVGCVVGVRLHDGRRVVVKVHGPRASPRFIAAVQTVQRHLFAGGFPAPEPLVGPTPFGGGTAVVEALLDRGDHADAHEPAIRRAMAEGLAEFVARCRPVAAALHDLDDHLMTVAPGSLWPKPHDDRFDFDATAAGAEAIDRVGAAARRILDEGAGELVIGHSDWRAQHLRFAGGRITAVYDWDSVIREREPVLAGSVAHGFTADWDAEPDRQRPTLSEALAFIADYEAARDTPFSDAEQRTARAALTYAMAYSARCEHSDARLMPWGELDPPADSARAFIAAHGQELLDPARRPAPSADRNALGRPAPAA